MGREEVKEERRIRVVSMTIDEELLDQLETYAIRNKLSRSEVIRRAVKRLLKEGEAQ
jgi:metal-responsive CopG/Arc/MetJ family transcriptional regulator